MYMSLHSMFMFIDCQMRIYLYTYHVCITYRRVYTLRCTYHVCTWYRHVCKFPIWYRHVCIYLKMYRRVYTMYRPCLYDSIVHTRYVQCIYMSVHVYVRWSGFQMMSLIDTVPNRDSQAQ
jgi:hypothetical protein